jgi:phosphate starvation-inducible protein PhoH and related proteins
MTTDFFPAAAKTQGQQDLLASLRSNAITICSGPAGVGKTLIALSEAIALQRAREIRTIYYTKPIVQFENLQGIGFLPGEEGTKLAPLLYPVLDNLSVLCKDGLAKYLIDKKLIQPILMQDLRGRSLNDAMLIIDEAQNATLHDLTLCLTRLGDRSKIAVLGDAEQKDNKGKFENGLAIAIKRLANIESVGCVMMSFADVQRAGGLVGKIQRALA